MHYGTDILAFLYNRTRNHEDAEDLLQETYIRAINSSDNIRDKSKIRSYLFSIAHNLMINHAKKKREVLVDTNDGNSGTIFEQLSDGQSSTPEAVADYRELKTKVLEIMKTMTPDQQKAFQLGVLEKKPYSEIARITNWSLASVKINVYRARKKAVNGLSDWRDVDQEGLKR